MPYNGSGVFNTAITFVPNTSATAEDQNTQDQDIATGLSNCMTRDGQAPAKANLSMGGFKLNQVGLAAAGTDAVNLTQVNSVIPIGVILDWAGSIAPQNFFLCNGQAVSRTVYVALFGVIGTIYGAGDGSTTFNVPDLRGRVAAMLDGGVGRLTGVSMTPDGNTLGAVGGAQTETLLTSNLPPYTPGGLVSLNSLPSSTAQLLTSAAQLAVPVGSGNSAIAASSIVAFGTPTAAFLGAAQGGTSAPLLTVQPTLLLNKIIRAS